MRSTWYIFEQFTKRTSLVYPTPIICCDHPTDNYPTTSTITTITTSPGHSPPASLKVNIAKEHPQFKERYTPTRRHNLGSDLQHSQEETGKKRNNSLVAKTKGKEEGDQTDQVDQENQAMEEKDPKETDQAPAKTTLRDHKKA
ncbi:hypothetical protein NUW54_g5895 [Trametes sanguinea]|uniref:Uncharacterized protein n=1 Tax=Trametes sanguinea TaxID=158606 RepID=A0ACC1PTT4_9APHY|nr:hypothetical protein NUW54_g5895 [Trametes sanguinea]